MIMIFARFLLCWFTSDVSIVFQFSQRAMHRGQNLVFRQSWRVPAEQNDIPLSSIFCLLKYSWELMISFRSFGKQMMSKLTRSRIVWARTDENSENL